MSDIPDWLVELAAQGEPDEDDEEIDSASEPLEFDSSNSFTFAAAPQTVAEPPTLDMGSVEMDEEDASAQDLMSSLRSQVEAEAVTDAATLEKRSSSGFSLRLPGLLPWQQLVLTVLLFLDVIVIGLLILVMLGRVSLF